MQVTMVKGFDAVNNTQTVANGAISIDALVAARLAAQYPEFPVNNAYSFQHKTVTIPASGFLDLTSQFNVGPENFPIAWTAVVLDSAGEPISETSKPIRMVYSSAPAPVSSPVTPPVKPPVMSPVTAPVRPPVKTPVMPPVISPVTPSIKPPAMPPVSTQFIPPITPPISRPVSPPISRPVSPPVKSPIPPSVPPPVASPVALPVAPPTTVTKGITGLSLVDIDAPLTKIPITTGAVISIASVGGGPFNIEAQTIGSISSLTFSYNGRKVQTENSAPFTFCGDTITNYFACTQFVAGTHTILAKAFPKASGTGISFSNMTVTFTLVA